MNDEGRKERRKGVGERERGFVGTNAKSWDIWAWKGAPRAQRTAQAAEAALPPRVSLLPPLGVEAPRSKHLLISCLQSPSAVILEPPKIKAVTVSTVSPCICHEVMGPDADLGFLNIEF